MAKNELDRIIDTPETADATRSSMYTSGSSSSTAALNNHTHSAVAGDGGNSLTATTTTWNFLLDAVTTATIQAALDQLDSYGMFVKTTVSSGATLTVPDGYQQLVFGPYTIDGDVVLNGDLIIL